MQMGCVGSEQMWSFGEHDLVLTYVDLHVLLWNNQICGNPNLQIKNELVNFSSRKKKIYTSQNNLPLDSLKSLMLLWVHSHNTSLNHIMGSYLRSFVFQADSLESKEVYKKHSFPLRLVSRCNTCRHTLDVFVQLMNCQQDEKSFRAPFNSLLPLLLL